MKPKFQYDIHHIEERPCHYPMTKQDLHEARVENRQAIPSSSSKKNFDQGKEDSNVVSGFLMDFRLNVKHQSQGKE